MNKTDLIKKEIKEAKNNLNILYENLRNASNESLKKSIKSDIEVIENTRDILVELLDKYNNGSGDLELSTLVNNNDNDFNNYLGYGFNIPANKLQEFYKIRDLKNSLDIVNENYLSKEEIYEYLNDYNEIMSLARENFYVPLKEVFSKYMSLTNQNGKNNFFYYQNMIKLHILYVNASILSVIKDEDFEYLCAMDPELAEITKIGDLTFLKEKFIVSTDSSRFKKSHIFNFVRNAFFHSDSNELYKITPDCNIINISLKQTNPIPFNIKITANDIFRMADAVRRYSHHTTAFELKNQDQIIVDNLFKTYNDFSLELDKTKLVRKMLPEGISFRNEDIIKDYKASSAFTSSSLFDSVLSKYGTLTEKEYSFSEKQKELLYNKFSYFNKYLKVMDMKYFVMPIVFNYMPTGINKLNFLTFESSIAYTYLFNSNNSMYDITNDIGLDYMYLLSGNSRPASKASIFDLITEEVDHNKYGYLYLFDDQEKKNFDDVLLLKYVYGTVNDSEKIDIGGVEYSSDLIRNAFTHNRWRGFINKKGERSFYLYDDESTLADPDNCYWNGIFTYDELKKTADNIMQNYKTTNKVKKI